MPRYRAGHREGQQGHYYAALLGLKRHDAQYVVEQLRRGLPYSALERFHESSTLSVQTLARTMEIADRTRFRRKQEGRLDPFESERLLRIARVFARALELYEGDLKAAVAWLESPARALGGVAPLELAKTEVGSLEVERLIGRIEHGIAI